MIPDVVSGQFNRFLNLETDDTNELGVLVFLGVAVSATDIEMKIQKRTPSFSLSIQGRAVIDKFLTSLEHLKIGNVIRLEPDGSILVVREHALSSHPQKIP